MQFTTPCDPAEVTSQAWEWEAMLKELRDVSNKYYKGMISASRKQLTLKY